MTSDISKLVNLTYLKFDDSDDLKHMHESISCLQKLEVMYINGSSLTELPSGLGKLVKLSTFEISTSGPLRFPPTLQVSESDGF